MPFDAALWARLRPVIAQATDGLTSSELASAAQLSAATMKRRLGGFLAAGLLRRSGQASATRYHITALDAASPPSELTVRQAQTPAWSAQTQRIRHALGQPLMTRKPVSYDRRTIEDYVPNASALLPPSLAESMLAKGRLKDQQPAGTYARKVLESLLIDLSWSSSKLEGNRYSLLDTKELFERGSSRQDSDTVMLLNHKRAIEFLVDEAPRIGPSMNVVRNLHALLMQDLLADERSLGAIRQQVVGIHGTVYLPLQVPALLEELLQTILDKAARINNAVEAAFFLWTQIAYLQPFEDGNKRTSRVAANIPLLIFNCAPLAFLDVDKQDYAEAMLGIYELRDLSMAVELFEWTYLRSCTKYAAVLEAAGGPDMFRVRYRDKLSDAVIAVVRARQGEDSALSLVQIPSADYDRFKDLFREQLKHLQPWNASRFRLNAEEVERWIAEGRSS